MRQEAITVAIVMGVFIILTPFVLWSFRNIIRYFRNREWQALRTLLVFSWHLLIPGIILIIIGITGGLNLI